MEINLTVKKYKSEGDLAHEYNPLHNKMNTDGSVGDFVTSELDFNLNKPVNIECQPSYDGTVNLIINDDLNPPRIVNTRYSIIEDNKYRRIERNQTEQTNLYKEGKIDAQTRLFRNIDKIPKVELLDISYHGQLKGGNYTFYFKLADNDFNKTDIVAESGIISVYKGTLERLYSISGTLEDERTDKSISLQLNNIDTSFVKVFVYYRRDYSDLNGISKHETCLIRKPYKIIGSSLLLNIDGFEDVEVINDEELNIRYNICTGVKTQAQVQNMLFFGNIQQTMVANDELQNISYFIEAKCVKKDDSIGYINPENYSAQLGENIRKTEYYNPLQIYYSLGYWPTELYRMGVVYIFQDDSLSPVYNLRGCKFTSTESNSINKEQYCNFIYGDKDHSFTSLYDDNGNIVSINKEDFFLPDSLYLSNTKGVFKFPDTEIIDHNKKEIHPLGVKFTLNMDLIKLLRSDKYKVKGLFFVRQNRIPTILAQGFSIGVDKTSYIPMLFNPEKYQDANEEYTNGYYFTESFINKSRSLTTTYKDRIIRTNQKQSSGLLCLDASVNKQLQSMFDNSEFVLEKSNSFSITNQSGMERSYWIKQNNLSNNQNSYQKKILSKLVYVETDTPLRYVDDYGYSTRVGSSEDAKDIRFFESKDYRETNYKIVRGVYCPFLGSNQSLEDSSIYSIRVSNYSENYETNYFKIRGNDLSPFMAISQRYELDDKELIDKRYKLYKKTINGDQETIELIATDLPYTEYTSSDENITFIQELEKVSLPIIFRGDCFTATVTIRINTNFIDSEVPINELIINPNTWKDAYKGYSNTSVDDWNDINRGDINSVPMGQWFTYKCLSNYNLGLRSENKQYLEEMSLMGNPRSFYPLNGMTTMPSGKIPESDILNSGYSVTLPFKKYFTLPNVPYIKDIFDTRIMFSNVQIEDDFRNAYRVFQGLDYKDIERQYGAIVKLIALGVNLFCVFEHGCAIIPINEKALVATTTGQSIHMYGAGVLQNQVTPVSPDYGSIWQESIIRTPNGIYGVDTCAKKIWRYNAKGFMLISDMIVQRFLNDNIILQENDKEPTISLKNVKTHYNNYKGDVMFTFYNGDKVWNLCYNERLEKWITKYSWTPLSSENINNIFLSLDRKRASLYGIIYNNINTQSGAHIEDRIGYERPCGNLWEYNNITRTIIMKGYEFFDKFNVKITSISSSILDEHDVEREILFTETPNSEYDIKCQIVNDKTFTFSRYIIESDNLNDDINTNQIIIEQDDHNLTLKIPNNAKLSKLLYLKINFNVTPVIDGNNNNEDLTISNSVQALSNTIEESIILIRDVTTLNSEDIIHYEKLLRNGFYVHGKSGIFDEINNFNEDTDDNILPTRWYNKQEPFEFEFVVNTPAGMHKIFDNLIFITNNVEPNSLEFELIGDVYNFNKAGIYQSEHLSKDPYWNIDGTFNSASYEKDKINKEYPNDSNYSNLFDKEQVTIYKDNVTGQYSLKIKQPIKNIKTYGRRIGNIEYKEDRWFSTITPIYYYNKQKDNNNEFYLSDLKSTRIRDKWVKIRIKYTGDKLVIINAIQSFLRLSYA